MGTATCGACRRIESAGMTAVLVTTLLLGPVIGTPVGAQSAQRDQMAKSATKKTNAAKPHTSPKNAVEPAGAKVPAAPRQAKMLDPARIDPIELDPTQIDPKKLDARTPNAWIALGLLEMRGGNLAGAQASFERAMVLGDQRRNKAAVAAAALALGRVHTGRLRFLGTEARNVAAFGARPDDQLTGSVRLEFEKAKALFERALALHEAVGRKDAMAADYSRLGDLYSTTKDFDQAQEMIGKALALNTALQRKKEMAGNYRALADTHRYDLDQAEALLKEAVALHEALGLKEEMATDYEKLGAINTVRGEPYEAERLYKQALALAPRRNQVSVLRALERLYRDRNDPGQAAEMKEEVSVLDKEREKDGGGRMLLFSASLGLFVSGFAAKDQVEALERVMPMEKTLGHRVGVATSYILLGLHYGQRAEIDEDKRAEFEGRAEAMFKDALALNANLRREDAMAHAYRELARIHDKRGNLDQVEATLKDARALHMKLGDESSMAQLYFSLGQDRKNRGDHGEACAYWRNGALAYPDERRLVDALNNNKCATTQ
jgi:tetratricopeptide (TPR) repeat protein